MRRLSDSARLLCLSRAMTASISEGSVEDGESCSVMMARHLTPIHDLRKALGTFHISMPMSRHFAEGLQLKRWG